jgi:hypothetical protein
MAIPEWYKDKEQEQCFALDWDNLSDDAYDNYIGAEVTLQKGDELTAASVKRRKLDEFGNAVGTSYANPILDTWLHTIEFADGKEAECSANVIAENMWDQCNIDGNQCQTLNAIIDHKTDGHAVQHADGFMVVNSHKHAEEHQGMATLHPMEGWVYKLGETSGS